MGMDATRLGPGTLTFGDSPEIDPSCQVKGMKLVPAGESDDAITGLSGCTDAGGRSYTWTLEGVLLQDLATPGGIVQFSHENAGLEVAFEFTPSTAAGTVVTGTLIMDPLTIGGDEYGSRMEAQVSFPVTDHAVTWPAAP